MQVETAFTAAWDAVTAQVYGPSVMADELDLAAMDADEAWQQVQDGTGVATGLHESVLQGTQLALTKGKCLHPGVACEPHSAHKETQQRVARHSACLDQR